MQSNSIEIKFFLKIFLLSICCVISYGSPVIYNQPYNNPNSYLPNRGYLTPPRAITTLNTFVPRRLIPPAPPRPAVPRVYENSQRVYTAPPVFRPIPPAPTTRRTFVNNTNNTPRYAFNYGVNDNRVNTSNYRLFPGFNFTAASPPPFVHFICTSTYAILDLNSFNFTVSSFFCNSNLSHFHRLAILRASRSDWRTAL